MLVVDSLFLWEEAWNAHPYCLTVMTNGYFSVNKFQLAIESRYLDDRGTTENALDMPPEELKKREVIFVDIAKKGSSEKLPVDEVDAFLLAQCRMFSRSTVRSVISVLWLLRGTRT